MDPTSINPDDIDVVEMRVTRVNAKDYSVNLISDGPNTTSAIEVPWTTPYRHPDGGGFDFIPEVGATCWCLWHPYDSLPTIIGFSSPASRNLVWASGRQELNPGDVIMWTRDNNRIIARRGGNIEVISTKECKRILIAARHTIEDTCRNWLLQTRGGTMSWFTDDSALSAKSGARSVFKLEAKRYGQDADPFVSLHTGGLDEDMSSGAPNSKKVLDLVIGSDRKNPLFRLSIGDDGTVEETIKGNRATTVQGNDTLTVTGERSVSAQQGFKFESASGGFSIVARSGAHSMNVQSSTEEISTVKRIKARTILLGQNPTNPAVLGRELVFWLATHAHPPTGGPAVNVAALQTILSKKVLIE